MASEGLRFMQRDEFPANTILGNSEGIRAGAVGPGLEFGKPLRVDLFNDVGSILELGSATNNLF